MNRNGFITFLIIVAAILVALLIWTHVRVDAAPAYPQATVLHNSAQAQAQVDITDCAFRLPQRPAGVGSFTAWAVYGYNTEAQLWAAEESDPQTHALLHSSTYNAYGLGVARISGTNHCNLGVIWVIEVGHVTNLTTIQPSPVTTFHHPTVTPKSTPTATTVACR